MKNDNLIEQLAAIEHQQWSFWAQTLITEEPGLSTQRIARWQRDLIPYGDLPEDRKELDRAWARRALACVQTGGQP